jgi:ferric iron reductase protein FhuF
MFFLEEFQWKISTNNQQSRRIFLLHYGELKNVQSCLFSTYEICSDLFWKNVSKKLYPQNSRKNDQKELNLLKSTRQFALFRIDLELTDLETLEVVEDFLVLRSSDAG